MIEKRKYLSLVLVVFLMSCIGNTVYAQKNGGSPYSRFGLGDIAKKGTAHSVAMGNTGLALRGVSFLNSKNPASYTALDSISFILDAGGYAEINKLSSVSSSDVFQKANFSYFSFGFSVKKWWAMAAGLRKMSDVGYGLEFTFQDSKAGSYKTKYTGNGGVNKVYWTNAFKLGNALSLGVNANFNWGSLKTNREVEFVSKQALPYRSTEDLTISNLNFDFGMQYEAKLNKDYSLVIGATFGNKADITGDYEFMSFVAGDTIRKEYKDERVLSIPNNFGIGLALNKDSKFIYTLDFNYHLWEDVATSYVIGRGNAELIKLRNSYKLGAGIAYTPDRMSITSYWNKISYRAGAYYEKTYLEVKENQLKEYGLTLGAGFPIKGRSSIDVALEFGTKGTTKNELLKEQFARLTVSFSLFEAWFRKVLYN